MKQKLKKTTQALSRFIKNSMRLSLWLWIAPFVTFVVAVSAWLVLALNKEARTAASIAITKFPQPFTSSQVLFGALILLLIAAALYFWLDYKQHNTLLKSGDPHIGYSAVHHAKKVVLPKLKYNWKQSLGWVGYGLVSMIVLTGVISLHVVPVLAASPSVTINQKPGSNDPNPSYTSVFEIVFSGAIDKDTFTSDDITLGGTAAGQAVQSITESGSFDGTTFDIRIAATAAGTITPSLAAEVVTSASTADTNHASTSTDNTVTYDGTWSPNEFVTTWKTDNPDPWGNTTQITIPTTGGGYNYSVNWGDGNVTSGRTGNATHTYASAGTYTVKITGNFPRIHLHESPYPGKLVALEQWGTKHWSSMERAFGHASNLEITATDAPNLSGVTDMSEMFTSTGFNSDINSTGFNSDINHWDVSNVTTMRMMFENATSFNQPLDSWDTDSLTDMVWMFADATSFNQPLSNWDVSNVTNMEGIFLGASSFNSDINGWDMSNVTNTYRMFGNATSFNQPLNNWDTSSLMYAYQMFMHATSFNQTLDSWDTSSMVEMDSMFTGATSFNQPLDAWNVGNLVAASYMLENTALSTANYDTTLISWAGQSLQSNVTLTAAPTAYCNAAGARAHVIATYNWAITDGGEDCTPQVDFTNAFITTWETGDDPDDRSIRIPGHFPGDETYNYSVDWGDGTIEAGITSPVYSEHTYSEQGVYTVKITGDFPRIYFGNPLTGGSGTRDKILSVEQWGNIEWTSMERAFMYTPNLVINATDIPDLSQVTSLKEMFAFNHSLNTPTNINNWDVSSVTDMSGMFMLATAFNQPLNNWDVSNVTNMTGMFAFATAFNQPLNSWNTSNVTNMQVMFYGATNFNQPLANWEVGNVANMAIMFAGASSFNQSLAGWDVSHVSMDSPGMLYMFNKEPLSLETSAPAVAPSGLSTSNYDATLASWSAQGLQDDIIFNAGTSTYCNAEAQRQSMIDTFSWTINDSGKDCASTLKYAHTLSPDKLSSTQARFKGSVSGAGAGNFASGGFEWGTSPSYGTTINSRPISSNNFNATVTLACDTQYHYRVFAVDSGGNKTYGANTTFTLPCPSSPPPPTTPPPENPPPAAAPKISIVSPKPNEGFKTGSDVILKADVSGEAGIKEVRFYVDGELVGTVSSSPYEYTLKNLPEGAHTLIAVVEDINGRERATDSQTFFVNKAGESPMALLDPESFRATMSNIEQNKYSLIGFSADVARNIPWVLLMLLAAGYLVQAYRQTKQNQRVKDGLALIAKTREGLDGFLHIVTHYLGTPITTISLAIEAASATKPAAVPTGLKNTTERLKTYINNLIASLNEHAAPIKQELEFAGKVKPYSLWLWVVLPIGGAALLMALSLVAAPRAGLWGSGTASAVFSTALFVGAAVLTVLFFRWWQRGRQLNANLSATKKTAEALLEERKTFITDHQKELNSYAEEVSVYAGSIVDEGFTKHFESGARQLHKVADAFNQAAQLIGVASLAQAKKRTVSIEDEVLKFKDTADGSQLELLYEGEPSVKSPLSSQELAFILPALIDNSLQFTPAGGHIYVSAKNKGKRFILTVADTGTGIEKEKLSTLLQPFARATSTETYDYEGLGLNLYLTRLIAEKYNGSVAIKSAKGKGTVVMVSVP